MAAWCACPSHSQPGVRIQLTGPPSLSFAESVCCPTPSSDSGLHHFLSSWSQWTPVAAVIEDAHIFCDHSATSSALVLQLSRLQCSLAGGDCRRSRCTQLVLFVVSLLPGITPGWLNTNLCSLLRCQTCLWKNYWLLNLTWALKNKNKRNGHFKQNNMTSSTGTHCSEQRAHPRFAAHSLIPPTTALEDLHWHFSAGQDFN